MMRDTSRFVVVFKKKVEATLRVATLETERTTFWEFENRERYPTTAIIVAFIYVSTVG